MPRPLQVDLCHFDLESGVRVMCDVGYLCANFSLPRPLCSRLRLDVRDRQTSDVRRASSLNAPYPTALRNALYKFKTYLLTYGRGHNNLSRMLYTVTVVEQQTPSAVVARNTRNRPPSRRLPSRFQLVENTCAD